MMTLEEVAGRVHGVVVRNAAFESLGFLQHRWSGKLTFAESAAALDRVRSSSSISAVITNSALAPLVPQEMGILVVESPRDAFFELHEYLATHTRFYGTLGETTIAEGAVVHPRAYIAPDGVDIGEGVRVEPNATILPGATIGAGSVIRAGAVVGAEGFQVTLSRSGVRRLTHAGGVRVGLNVEVQGNCSLDRALFGGATVIGDDTTIDKLVYVAHHVSLGRRCRVGAGAVIAGSVSVGDEVWIGPNATISDGLTLGDRASVTLGSVVTRDVPPGIRVTGNFAVPHERFLDALRRSR